MGFTIYASITYLTLICLRFWFFKFNVTEHDRSNWYLVCTTVDIYPFSILTNEIITEKVPNYESCEIISPFIIMNKVMEGHCSQFTSNVPDKMQKLIEKYWKEGQEIVHILKSNFSYSR
ncbi:hypothetical protein M9Y10_026985 [Tritrichomonas musculus]|uniref:Uncharacterized protein n=1 Tax=Tritrichomonas musculus TaxID=1915356 RepID=A0ABR2H7J7_9EUKA